MPDPVGPPIPATCAHRPTVGGRVIPYINVRLADGGVDFRRQHTARMVEILENGWCQVCATPLQRPLVLLGGSTSLKQLLFPEPPLHPECAVYTTKACPMVAGEVTEARSGPSVAEGKRGEKCFEPGCDCDGWVNNTGEGPVEPHTWFAVYARNFRIAYDTGGKPLGALVFPDEVLVVRKVSEPGQGRCWQVVPDALAGYERPVLTFG